MQSEDQNFYQELHSIMATPFANHEGSVIIIKYSALEDHYKQFLKRFGLQNELSDIFDETSDDFKGRITRTKKALLKNSGSQQQACSIYHLFFLCLAESAEASYTGSEYNKTKFMSIQRSFMRKFFGSFKTPELHSLFKDIYAHGMTELFEMHLKADNILPKELNKKYETWKNLPKTKNLMADNSPEYSLNSKIEDKTTASHPVADKQAFFDGVDIQPYMETYDSVNLTSEKCRNTAISISQAMMSVSRRTRLKTGLIKTLAIGDKELSRKLLVGVFLKFTRRATDLHIENNVTGREKDPHGYNEELCHLALNHKQTRELFFQAALDNDFLPELYFILNAHDSYAPEGTVEKLKQWCEKKGIQLDDELEAYELPAMDDLDAIIAKGYAARQAMAPTVQDVTVAEQPTEEAQPKDIETSIPVGDIADNNISLNFIPVEGLHVIATGSAEPVAVDKLLRDNESVREREPIDHINMICTRLKNYLDIDGDIEVYGSDKAARKIAMGEPDYELKIIQFRTTDGQLHQWATNDWKGSGTHVIKPPVAIDPTQGILVNISELRENGSSWPLKHQDEEVYLSKMAEMTMTLKEDMVAYLPKFFGWTNSPNIADELIETAAEHLRATGKKITSGGRIGATRAKTTDNHVPFYVGPLKGLTTPARAFSSLNAVGFESREELYEFVFAEYPELKAHVNKPAIRARDAFNEAADYIAYNSKVPQLAHAGNYKICGHDLAKLSGFFTLSEQGCITYWKEVMEDPRQAEIPSNWDEFMVACGLAERITGELEPNWGHPRLANVGAKPGVLIAS